MLRIVVSTLVAVAALGVGFYAGGWKGLGIVAICEAFGAIRATKS